MAKKFQGFKNVGQESFPTYWAVFRDAATGATEDRERMVVDMLYTMGGTDTIPQGELLRAKQAYQNPEAHLLALSK